MQNPLTLRAQGEREIVASRDGRVRWRWQAKEPVQPVGTQDGVTVVWERLGADTIRLTGLEADTGRPRWSAVHGGVIAPNPSLYGRALLFKGTHRLNTTGVWVVVDTRTGRTVLTTGATLRRNTPSELLWVEPAGPPPSQSGGRLTVIRLDPIRMRGRRLELPLPLPQGVELDEQPAVDVRIEGDRIEARFEGVRSDSRKPAYFVARYRWSAGPRQKPDLQMLEKPDGAK